MASELIGQTVLGYTIVEFIGEGGMASVWRAENVDLGTTVAIKVMDPGLARNSDMVERFMDEARIQVRLVHDNIVRVENLCREPPAMVLELVHGRPLSRVIGKEVGAMPLQRAWPMMDSIMSAVAYAHDQGVVHRDIKPSNMLVSANDQIKVMDFGIAKVLGTGGRTRTGATLGTPAYMAPEQIKGARDVDERADIYALGITFYEMLAGQTPFERDKHTDSEFELMEAQVHQEPPDPRAFYPGVHEAVVPVLRRALDKAPERRFQSVHEMRAAWQQIAATALPGAPAAARPPVGPPSAGGKRPAPTVIQDGPSMGPCLSAAPVPAHNTVVEQAPAVSGYPTPGAVVPAPPPNRAPLLILAVVAGAMLVVGLAVGLLMLRGASPDRAPRRAAVVDPDPDDDDEESSPSSRRRTPRAPAEAPAAATRKPLPTAAEAHTAKEGAALILDATRTPVSQVAALAREMSLKFGSGETPRRQIAAAVNSRAVDLFKASESETSLSRPLREEKVSQALDLHKLAAAMDFTYGLPRYNAAKIYATRNDVKNCVKYLQQLKSMQSDMRLNVAQRRWQAKPLSWALKSDHFRRVRGDPRFQAVYR